jgi:hypothetical protein
VSEPSLARARRSAPQQPAGEVPPAPQQPAGEVPPAPQQPASQRRPAESSLERWTASVSAADEPAVVIDAHETIVAMSGAMQDLLGLGTAAIGRDVLDTLALLDFADGGVLAEGEAVKIPPLLALHSGGLARGLVRIRRPGGYVMFDAVAAPLTESGQVIGSITFFSTVRP